MKMIYLLLFMLYFCLNNCLLRLGFREMIVEYKFYYVECFFGYFEVNCFKLCFYNIYGKGCIEKCNCFNCYYVFGCVIGKVC